jgi:hypothetical protein
MEDTVRLARELCGDAHLYGGHACLSCQSAARQLMARSDGAVPIQSPPHGTSHRASRSHWARLLAGTASIVGMLGFMLVGASAAGASPDDWWFGQSKAMIRGAGASQTSAGSHGLGVYARNNGAPDEAWGQFRFGEDVEGGHGDAGEVHCLTRDAKGLMQVSGRLFASGGRDDAGRDFAVTIDTESQPQRFSGVRIGAPGTIAPCSGGTADFYPVTRGGYESSPPSGS